MVSKPKLFLAFDILKEEIDFEVADTTKWDKLCANWCLGHRLTSFFLQLKGAVLTAHNSVRKAFKSLKHTYKRKIVRSENYTKVPKELDTLDTWPDAMAILNALGAFMKQVVNGILTQCSEQDGLGRGH